MENKTIIFSQKQLDEIIGKETVSEVDGGNAAYLDNITNDFVKNGNNEVYTGEKMDKTDAKPLYTDKYAKQRSLDYGPWMPDGRGGSKGSLDYTNHMITCSKKEWTAKNVVNEINSNLASNTYGDSKNRVSHNNASVLKARYHAAQTKDTSRHRSSSLFPIWRMSWSHCPDGENDHKSAHPQWWSYPHVYGRYGW